MGLESDLHFRYCKSHRGVASGALEEYLNRCRRDPNWEVNGVQSERRLVTYSAQAVHSWPNRRQSLDMASSPAFAIIHLPSVVIVIVIVIGHGLLPCICHHTLLCSSDWWAGYDIWCEDLTLLYMLGRGVGTLHPHVTFFWPKEDFQRQSGISI